MLGFDGPPFEVQYHGTVKIDLYSNKKRDYLNTGRETGRQADRQTDRPKESSLSCFDVKAGFTSLRSLVRLAKSPNF